MKSFLDREELGGRALWGLIKEPKSGLGKEAGLQRASPTREKRGAGHVSAVPSSQTCRRNVPGEERPSMEKGRKGQGPARAAVTKHRGMGDLNVELLPHRPRG